MLMFSQVPEKPKKGLKRKRVEEEEEIGDEYFYDIGGLDQLVREVQEADPFFDEDDDDFLDFEEPTVPELAEWPEWKAMLDKADHEIDHPQEAKAIPYPYGYGIDGGWGGPN